MKCLQTQDFTSSSIFKDYNSDRMYSTVHIKYLFVLCSLEDPFNLLFKLSKNKICRDCNEIRKNLATSVSVFLLVY